MYYKNSSFDVKVISVLHDIPSRLLPAGKCAKWIVVVCVLDRLAHAVTTFCRKTAILFTKIVNSRTIIRFANSQYYVSTPTLDLKTVIYRTWMPVALCVK